MNLKNLKLNLVELNKSESRELRDKYIAKFINTDVALFKKQILTMHEFIDGSCYLGYLWDYLKDPVIVKKEYIESIAEKVNEVYVFWDIHSSERILIKNYWKFNKDAILKLSIKTLMAGEEYLPEDIYIFDESLTWTFIKTHEDIDGKVFCLKSGQI